jgi:hypothetical protein
MPSEIFVDPNAAPGEVIRVGGQCYVRDGPSNEPAGVFERERGTSLFVKMSDIRTPIARKWLRELDSGQYRE